MGCGVHMRGGEGDGRGVHTLSWICDAWSSL